MSVELLSPLQPICLDLRLCPCTDPTPTETPPVVKSSSHCSLRFPETVLLEVPLSKTSSAALGSMLDIGFLFSMRTANLELTISPNMLVQNDKLAQLTLTH